MRDNKLYYSLLLGVFVALCITFTPSYAETIETQVSSDQVSLGDTLTISYTINKSINLNSSDLAPLENDFRILSVNQGKSIIIINGAAKKQTIIQLTVEPKKTGVIMIPEINFGDVKSSSHKLMVAEHAQQAVNTRQDSPVFVEAAISTATPYIQSQVVYTFKLFYQSNIDNPRIEIPQIKDATIIQLDDNRNYQTTIKGKGYLVVEKSFAIFPQKTGDLSIAATHFSGVAYDVNPMAVNDPFFSTPLQQVRLSTQAFALKVKPIPDAFHGTTWLPANRLNINEIWSTTSDQWETGNPVTRTIFVEANGLRADQIPDLTFDKINGVNTYIDPPKRSNKVQGNTVTGVLEQKITYIPTQAQPFAIPAVKINWWNVQTNVNEIAQSNSLNVQVLAAHDKAATVSNNHNAKSAILGFSKGAQPGLQGVTNQQKVSPFYTSIWFWISVLLSSIWLITLWLFWSRRILINNHAPTTPQIDTQTVPETIEISEEGFAQACEQGDANSAQHFLLSWSKKHWQETPLNLEKLHAYTSDEHFKLALSNLQKAIYAKNTVTWNGSDLLTAYRHVKKNVKSNFHFPATSKPDKHIKLDPLPPLNP